MPQNDGDVNNGLWPCLQGYFSLARMQWRCLQPGPFRKFAEYQEAPRSSTYTDIVKGEFGEGCWKQLSSSLGVEGVLGLRKGV